MQTSVGFFLDTPPHRLPSSRGSMKLNLGPLFLDIRIVRSRADNGDFIL